MIEPRPWSTIWKQPRETIQRIVDTNPKYFFYPLVILGGIAQTLSGVRGMGEMLPFSELLLVSILSGPLSGLLSIYVGGFVLHLISQRMGGVAPREHIRTVIAWSWAPMVYTLPLWGVKIILFRDELFKVEKPFIESQAVLSGIYDILSVVDFAIFVLYLYILFMGLSQVNRFSLMRGVFSWLIMYAVLFVLLGIPMLLLAQFMGQTIPF